MIELLIAGVSFVVGLGCGYATRAYVSRRRRRRRTWRRQYQYPARIEPISNPHDNEVKRQLRLFD
jgi:hypothetical protein